MNFKVIEDVKSKQYLNFDDCLLDLRSAKDKFTNLHSNGNCICNDIFYLDEIQLKFIIEQYSIFSKEAIHMLLDAMIRNYDWPELFKELQNNIEEEKGQETKGIPHLEIMRRGYEKDLKILTDNVIPSLVTKSFIGKMRKIFNNNDNAYSAGALLAFEGIAIQEFHIVDKLVRKYDEATKKNNIKYKQTLTSYYINGHKDFEIGHEQHLADSIRPYITDKNINKMIVGYFDVCFAMDLWWEQLMLESLQVLFSEKNKLENIEEFDLESVIIK